MTQTWLHVGLPKCGSTTLQRHFAEHEAAHLRHGLLYPETGRSPVGYRAHRPLWHARAALPELARGIADEARRKGARTVVVSCEEFGARLPADPAGRNVADALEAATGGPVRIVAWLRHPADLAVSAFAQFADQGLFGVDRARFWAGGPGSVARYLAAYREARGRDLLSPLGHARAVVDGFPGREVTLRSAERADLGRGLLADFCAFFDLPRLPGPSRRNRRAAARATALMVEAHERFGLAAYGDRRAGLLPWLDARADDGFAPARLRLPADEHDRLNDLLDRERPALRAIFATPVDALTERRAPDPGADEWLTDEEVAELSRRMADRG